MTGEDVSVNADFVEITQASEELVNSLEKNNTSKHVTENSSIEHIDIDSELETKRSSKVKEKHPINLELNPKISDIHFPNNFELNIPKIEIPLKQVNHSSEKGQSIRGEKKMNQCHVDRDLNRHHNDKNKFVIRAIVLIGIVTILLMLFHAFVVVKTVNSV